MTDSKPGSQGVDGGIHHTISSRNDQSQISFNKQNLGYIGILTGNNQEKAGNIAFVSIVISFVLIGLIIFVPQKYEDTSRDRLLLIPSSIITLALGYLFGKK